MNNKNIDELRKKILLFADGASLEQIKEKHIIDIDGYTFNPSIFKKSNVTNYLDYCKKIVNQVFLKDMESSSY